MIPLESRCVISYVVEWQYLRLSDIIPSTLMNLLDCLTLVTTNIGDQPVLAVNRAYYFFGSLQPSADLTNRKKGGGKESAIFCGYTQEF